MLKTCPLLENAGFPETEGAGPLIRLKGGSVRRLMDGSAEYRARIEIEVTEGAFGIAEWLLERAENVTVPRAAALSSGTKYLIEADVVIKGE